ncbi:hypothetical protein CPAR01_04932 [Colletotrichum paranaense]|uniref:Cyclin N-terminal domain-containing protein n=5 Tax=Colletotrichum acutatum species complex TaxID=2707335 RepID=A0A9P9XHY3_9PEZI|nr:uncharacterized protein CLUP02_17473 [Colletotrichum lupini]XP_053050108.1 uncharacterized protein COL516b_005381 [Colletotrichum fioriniae]XP_060353418.1 uncharacterized protein CPAR01_04932 [Colletotrichum paranaense]XP_060386718.1 uncharacterized protein CTAM01_02877 [Colletotrichum tamarilloi]XP_060402079.1 uncharacterized protein CABS01_08563 [Colletotrichum abscissum]KAI3539542.1 hypothetical protein CSPX01_08758 [Colletotrichum filicis]KAK1447715.1 hypothetical protein CMEL01_09554 
MGNMARQVQNTDYSDDEYGAEDAYFTYRPLSNLPTPPPSSRNSSAHQSPKTALEEGDILQEKFLGPAIHLVNLVPTSASLTTPSVPLVQAMLSRSGLPLETIALAVCILDSLNSKFALSWRLQCPLLVDGSSYNKRHTLGHSPLLDRRRQQQLHIDSVQPELIILSALIIAAKFTDDCHDSTSYYSSNWGKDTWSCEQINVTERCICENLNYRIKPLVDDEDLLADTMVDMQLAARHYNSARPVQPHEMGHSKSKSMTIGTAVIGLGLQLTPVDTPKSEVESFGDEVRAALEKTTFGGDYMSLTFSGNDMGLSPVGEEF